MRAPARRIISAIIAAICIGTNAGAQTPPAPAPDPYVERNRLFVLTDIGGEPDDQESAVRLLLYANVIDVEGIASTLAPKPAVDILYKLIDGYGGVRTNLMKNARGWPEAKKLKSVVFTGPQGSGMAAIRDDQPSSGALALIRATDKADTRPLWVSIWGGAATLAEALKIVRKTRSVSDLDAFVGKLRVYSISDQDDAGPWLRREFPKLRYIAQPSSSYDDFGAATWTGISGDKFYRNDELSADPTTITNSWLERNIRKGPFGALYPIPQFIMEGDTPSFLGLIPNGLASAASPAWGGWGGRYVFRKPYGETRSFWTQGGYPNYRVNSRDEVVGMDGHKALSDQATIWRWRQAFQNDFAARMDWTIKGFAETNHHPIAVVNGVRGAAPIVLDVRPDQAITLDAAGSSDPDSGQVLSYRWFHYREAGAGLGAPADVTIVGENTQRATVTVGKGCPPFFPGLNMKIICRMQAAHIILEVTDNGGPPLTSYRRTILNVKDTN